MKTVKKFLLAMCTLCVLALPLAGCNTVQGMGQDVQATGDAITGASYPYPYSSSYYYD